MLEKLNAGYYDRILADKEAKETERKQAEEQPKDFYVELAEEVHNADWDIRKEKIAGSLIPQSAGGLEIALALLGIGIRYNERAGDIEWSFVDTEIPQLWHVNTDNEWVPQSDLIDSRVREAIRDMFMFDTGQPAMWNKERWTTSLYALADFMRVDPFLEWVKTLQWDNTPRLDFWIETVFEVQEGQNLDLVRWASKQILIAACKRAEHPGAKMDQMVVLAGPQGIGKSQCLAHLLPPQHGEWFTDSFSFLLDEQKRVEATLGTVIVEVGEMAGSTRREAAEIKQDMARTVDKIRLSYRRNAERFVRRHVRVGTSNGSGDLPNDPTGLRRFVPIDLVSVNQSEIKEPKEIKGWMDGCREQLWAEAWARRSESIFTEGALTRAAAAAAESHRYADEALELLAHEFALDQKGEKFTIRDFMQWLDSKAQYTGRLDNARCTKALQNVGCERVRERSGQGYRGRYFVLGSAKKDKVEETPTNVINEVANTTSSSETVNEQQPAAPPPQRTVGPDEVF